MALQIERLNIGSVQIDSSFLLHNNTAGTKITVPTWAYLILGSNEGPILVDTGFRNTAVLQVMGMKAVPDQSAGLERELGRCGLRPSDVRYIVHTHLHLDHAGKDDIFPMDTTVVVNRRELEVAAAYGTMAYPPQDTKHIIDRLYARDAAWLLDLVHYGPVEILPGIVCELAGGHTEGSMNVLVETEEGVACICGDIIYNLQEQVIRPMLLQHREYRTTGNYDVSLAQERAAVKKAMMSGRWILPMHDQPARLSSRGIVQGRLEGSTLPGPIIEVDAQSLTPLDHPEQEEISVDLANRWLN